MYYSHCPFDPREVEELIGEDVSAYEYAEIPSNECKLTSLVLAYVANKSSNNARRSYAIAQTNKDNDSDDDEDMGSEDDEWHTPAAEDECSRTKILAGKGCFAVDDMFVLYQTVGKPCGTDCAVDQKHVLLVFCPTAKGGIATIQAFCTRLIIDSERADPRRYSIYRWHLEHRYWRLDSRVPVRPIESIVLPAAMKNKVLGDVEDFLSPETRAFYLRHGIPYRRSLLFYGQPGAGKSSLIAGLAGKFGRNVCYVSICDEKMSDDALKDAVNRVPSRSIIVLEDIDSLFDKKRGKKNDTPLTFSGLLNALDGIGAAIGQLFVMTTNEAHNLDAALVRHGRVDLSVEFNSCVPEQAELMFANFYPDAPEP
ncbi:hypothetical protein CTAYLR_003665 [Chrysophaeum taylorii]|uniref:AAA+ ATPase domain-containing protein n=1 Tax=Chrysophaeum taylorii TaxID=2483200 RepID=A0AAD7UDY1_9STRA|nr:hypothetical protein CTAYLR_003665 [Chrysophaeum taylorii]